jgi:hypothetical protein
MLFAFFVVKEETPNNKSQKDKDTKDILAKYYFTDEV